MKPPPDLRQALRCSSLLRPPTRAGKVTLTAELIAALSYRALPTTNRQPAPSRESQIELPDPCPLPETFDERQRLRAGMIGLAAALAVLIMTVTHFRLIPHQGHVLAARATLALSRSFVAQENSDFVEVAISPNGRVLASATEDGVQLRDIITGRTIRVFPFSRSTPSLLPVHLAFSPNGRTLALSRAKEVRLLDISTERQTAVGKQSISAASFSPDSAVLFVSRPREVQLLNAATGQLIRTIKTPTNRTTKVSPNGKLLAFVRGEDNHLSIYRINDVRHPLYVGNARGENIEWAPDSKTLAAMTNAGVKIEGLLPERPRRTLATASPSALAFAPDSRLVAVSPSSSNGTVEIWDVATGKKIRELSASLAPSITAMAWSPDGRSLALTNRRQLQIWSASGSHA